MTKILIQVNMDRDTLTDEEIIEAAQECKEEVAHMLRERFNKTESKPIIMTKAKVEL